jgi:hypothetical protein
MYGPIVARSRQNISKFTTAYRDGYTPPPIGPQFLGELHVFGPVAAKRYATTAVGMIIQWTQSETLTPAADGLSYTVTGTSSMAPTYIVPVVVGLPPSGAPVVISGPLPLREQRTSVQVPQPASVPFRDAVRVALAGRDIQAAVENGWCENLDEMGVAALTEAQRLGGFDVQLTIDVDPDLREGHVVTVPACPELGHGAVSLLVQGCVTTLNFADFTARQELQCRWIPPEIR